MPVALPPAFASAISPVFKALPLGEALGRLVVDGPGPGAGYEAARARVAEALTDPALAGRPDLVAGLWLYVDELEPAHVAAQALDTPTGAFWHAVVHRREGDFSNARYWYARAAGHPAKERMDLTGGGAGSGTSVASYDAGEFVDGVEHAHTRGENQAPALQSLQNKEWRALFGWCVASVPPEAKS